jgi:hypothetical protein
MRLHNRQIKGNFWSDPDLVCELTRDQRMFFLGITQLAEDSGCLEYDPRSMKIILYPADNDITPNDLKEWIEKIIEMGKIVTYEVGGKKYLFIKNFHKHQSLKFPAPPEVPLPPWVQWQQKDERERYGQYVVINNNDNGHTYEHIHEDTYEDINEDINKDIHEHIHDDTHGQKIRQDNINKTYVSEFEEFWKNYPRKTDKKQAYFQWKARIKSGVSPGELLLSAKNYANECHQLKKEDRYIKHAKTFIGVNGSYEEYLNEKFQSKTPESIPKEKEKSWIDKQMEMSHEDLKKAGLL